jgi:hypothetical protein
MQRRRTTTCGRSTSTRKNPDTPHTTETHKHPKKRSRNFPTRRALEREKVVIRKLRPLLTLPKATTKPAVCELTRKRAKTFMSSTGTVQMIRRYAFQSQAYIQRLLIQLQNPRNWSRPKKFFVTFEICFLTFSVYIGSAIYTPGLMDVMSEFGVAQVPATLGLTLYVAGYGLGPVIWSPMSEIPQIGRLWVYIGTLCMCISTLDYHDSG